jgi:hypothetical protein
VTLDLDREYIAELVDMEERDNADAECRCGVTYYANGRAKDPSRLIFKWHLIDPEIDQPITHRGRHGEPEPEEIWEHAPTSLQRSASSWFGKMWRYFEALVGHSLEDDEIDALVTNEDGNDRLPFELCGTRVRVWLGTYSGRPKVERIRPLVVPKSTA